MTLPRDLSVSREDGRVRLRLGEYDLSHLLLNRGPIVERIHVDSTGRRPALCVVWLPVMFEGNVSDETHTVRVVTDGDAERITNGVPGEDA